MRAAPKDEAARRREAEMIRVQLEDLGFPAGALADVAAALDDFASKGWGLTRTFRMPELGVAVMLLLSTQPRVTSYARVRKM
jgi:hypothetical protein